MNDIERARSALNHLDASCSREEWVRIAMASKAAGLTFEDFHEWSKSANNYSNEKDCKSVWGSINENGGITAATLFKLANDKGLHNDNKINNINHTSCKSSNKAIEIWKLCDPATNHHPYIKHKSGNVEGLKIYPTSAPPLKIQEKNVSGYLVAPCFENSILQTLQFIPPENGKKLNLPGSSFNSGYFTVGTITNCIYVCEGLGQAWAVNKAMHEATVVCFGAGRMMKVAKVLRNTYPDMRLIIAPDRGKEIQAKAIASTIGGEWIEMPDNKASNYDTNDYAQEFGIEALRELLTDTKAPVTHDISAINRYAKPPLSICDARDGTAETRPLTELGNAYRLLDTHAGKLKYIPETKSWIAWNDASWKWSDASTARALAAKLPDVIYEEGKKNLSEAERYAKWARKSQEKKIIDAAVSLLSDQPQMRLSLNNIDANHFFVGFNHAQQIIDLRTGQARAAEPTDYVTKSLSVETIGDSAKAVLWKQFLQQIFDGDNELINWIQRFFGYSLTGSTQEQIFLFFYGLGANGKSVLSELLLYIMGDYGVVIAHETLCGGKRQAGSATPDLANLVGKRFGLSSETEENHALAEALVKGFVSGDSMTVRPLHCSPIELKPICKLIMTGNHKPVIRSNDNGIWRRVRLIPFNQTFSPKQRDARLLEKLKNEASHILAWMIEGCLNWQEHRLADIPEVIRHATEAYKTDQDIVGAWLNECTIQTNKNSEVSSTDLYTSYKEWCIGNGHLPSSSSVLGRRLGERGFEVRQSNGKRFWRGLCLINNKSIYSSQDYINAKGGF